MDQDFVNLFPILFNISDAVTDEEVQSWAATTIQSSFRQYKYNKMWSKVNNANKLVMAISGVKTDQGEDDIK